MQHKNVARTKSNTNKWNNVAKLLTYKANSSIVQVQQTKKETNEDGTSAVSKMI